MTPFTVLSTTKISNGDYKLPTQVNTELKKKLFNFMDRRSLAFNLDASCFVFVLHKTLNDYE